MRKLAILAGAVSLVAGATIAQASDHLFTATVAGGLTCAAGTGPGCTSTVTSQSQPFLNGINNPAAKTQDAVPGAGSPLSGLEHFVPATDTTTGAPVNASSSSAVMSGVPAVNAGKTAPAH
jgi:hypothetical protein